LKNIIFLVFATVSFIMSSSLSANAFSAKELPLSQSSDHWKVTLDKPETDDLKAEKGVFNLYSLDVKNIGDEVYDPIFEVYRSEPNSRTKYALTSSKDIPKTQDFFHHQNLPVSTKAKVIEVVVTWREKPYEQMKNGEKYPAQKFKQTFVFKQD
jgi:hypothetical protein